MSNTEPEPLKNTELLIKDQEISRLLEALSIANQKIAQLETDIQGFKSLNSDQMSRLQSEQTGDLEDMRK
jgi:hypothetical protein